MSVVEAALQLFKHRFKNQMFLLHICSKKLQIRLKFLFNLQLDRPSALPLSLSSVSSPYANEWVTSSLNCDWLPWE